MKLTRLVLPLALALVALAAPSIAQTTYTLGTSNCSPGGLANCHNVPLMETGTDVWVDLLPIADPTSSRFIDGIPVLSNFAEVNLDSTYQVTYAPTFTYTAPNGAVYIADIPNSQPQPGCVAGQPCHTHQLPLQVVGTFVEYQGTHTGSFNVAFGKYYYVNQCSGRGCGGTLGWHVYTVGGQIIVNAESGSATPLFKLEMPKYVNSIKGISNGPRPMYNYNELYITSCVTQYPWPTGKVLAGLSGIYTQFEAYCYTNYSPSTWETCSWYGSPWDPNGGYYLSCWL